MELPILEEKLAPHKNEAWYNAKTLEELNALICDCKKCDLWETRGKFVFGVGNPNAKVLVIGEAPGADEDKQGEPFVGRAGQLLNKMLEAIEFKREEIYICNILKSRPPNNRDPKPNEVAACEPYLWKQIAIVKPKLILCLGRIAGTNLLKMNEALSKMRGQTFDLGGIPVIVTYHPAALLRNPDWKHGAWEDLKRLRRMYEELPS
jgi:DNA polymerase